MRANCNLIKFSILLAVFLILFPSSSTAGWWNSGAQCDDIVDRTDGGYINVLTFNILFFSQEASVETRAEPIVEFLAAQDPPIDLIFLQEVVGGELALSDSNNSAKLLQEMLSERGLEYNLKNAFEVGIPGVFYTGNSILSRCEIQFSLVKRLPRESEIEIFGRVIRLPRNVQMARLKIPGFGKLNVYNTHLCAGCALAERGQQLSVLLGFMDTLENFIPGKDPILLAGDFNIDIFKDNGDEPFGPEKALYDMIIHSGFVDAYAQGASDILDNLCLDENSPDEYCTVGVTALDDGGKAGRIDYIFKMGPRFGLAYGSTVFFNPVVTEFPDELVSDHAAVFVRIPLLSSE